MGSSYPETGDANFRVALWIFEQPLALKMYARLSAYDQKRYVFHVCILAFLLSLGTSTRNCLFGQ